MSEEITKYNQPDRTNVYVAIDLHSTLEQRIHNKRAIENKIEQLEYQLNSNRTELEAITPVVDTLGKILTNHVKTLSNEDREIYIDVINGVVRATEKSIQDGTPVPCLNLHVL